MKIRFISLASGSSGNCYYLGTEKYGILIDAGIGIRTIKKSLKDINVTMDSIRAVFITHDHADHIKAVASKPGYERKGMDVYTTVRVPFTTAVLGGEAKVETLHGNVLCKINPGTQSGTKIRLRGKGIVSMKDKNQHGDQYVTVQIDVPGNLSEEAKRKLREFEVACKKGQQGVA